MWSGGAAQFTLIQPDGRIITPLDVAANPTQISYQAVASEAGYPASASYAFAFTKPGNWQMVIQSGTAKIAYVGFVALETDRTLTVQASNPGNVIFTPFALSVMLAGPHGPLDGATVMAQTYLPDGSAAASPLLGLGNGVYRFIDEDLAHVNDWVLIVLWANGVDQGVTFTRQVEVLRFTNGPSNLLYLPIVAR